MSFFTPFSCRLGFHLDQECYPIFTGPAILKYRGYAFKLPVWWKTDTEALILNYNKLIIYIDKRLFEEKRNVLNVICGLTLRHHQVHCQCKELTKDHYDRRCPQTWLTRSHIEKRYGNKISIQKGLILLMLNKNDHILWNIEKELNFIKLFGK